MDISQHLGGYLKAADCPQPRLLTIAAVNLEEMPDGEHKPVIEFEEVAGKLVANKTNLNFLVEAYGTSETDEWLGQQVVVYKTQTDFSGRRVDCLRVRMPKQKTPAKPASKKKPTKEPADETQEELDDIPF